MAAATGIVDYLTLIDWDLIDKRGLDPPTYGPPASTRVDGDSGGCDVIRTVFETPATDLPESGARIQLGDLF